MRRGRAVEGRGRAALGALAACALGVAAGCTAGPPAGPGTAGATAGPTTARGDDLPAEVLGALRVEVRQSRTDRAARVVQLAVHNDGTTDLDVVAARLVSPTVEDPAVAEDGRRAPAGTRRDISVALGDPVCGPGAGDRPAVEGEPGAPVDPGGTTTPGGTATPGSVAAGAGGVTVRLEVADEAGRRGTLDVEPADPNGHLARIHGEDCAAWAVAQGADLALGAQVVTRQDPDGRWVGELALTLTPREGGPEVLVDEVEATVLLDPARGGAVWPAGLSSAPGGVRTLPLDVVPARCDPHAVAEDKRGTAFGVHARVDGVPQHVFHVTADDALRGRVHELVALACGWPPS